LEVKTVSLQLHLTVYCFYTRLVIESRYN